MTNAELIAKLQELPMEAEVVIFADEDPNGGRRKLAIYEAMDLIYGWYISIDADK